MAEVLMRDETMTGREIGSWMLPDLPDRIPARELLRLRVREEVARFNAAGGELYRGLVRPAAATETPHGFRMPAGGRIDETAQADAACAAFERNGFVMIAGERQVESLDQIIDLRRDAEVAFIRLVALVGG
ncbi:hypothetical protein ACWT_6673 [Actinoplanes sp. SE50]|uniref:hypothetical protein n=1 Tax=unclassified Actinoplanes TaxID=2626549 RepID=UPI00023ECA3B|nr:MULTISPECIES: hypothetical protein [unclassified Actinoplanes]AEV87685.1 hypothetical protein ACPL_6803 [Actinoplanes sp. SE50/110]ATO86088.1 hypothetical protein ACWT_6673 [Actinoplanes sp. SE50]SLM03502.1 hypothetical protein ACSP50_6792 [Actinoplanes sp. SE50/110]